MVSLLAPAAFLLAAAAPSEAVTTTSGPVSGIKVDNGAVAWLGIPFAEAPVREGRWKPPQLVKSWTTPYHADRIAPECLQPMRQHEYNHYFGDEPQSEDCLYLNVWAPSPSPEKLPVVVWIHGGSFVVGSGGKSLFNGSRLAAKGLIIVTINYRLGALGYLAHPELSAESPHQASGNYGLLDQVAALRWVNENIAAFGGDPERVTLMGQSAGAISISDLQVSPLAKGLFQRIIALSGSAYSDAFGTPALAEAEKQGLAFAKQLKATSLRDLRLLPADQIAAAHFTAARPVVDGWALPHAPTELYARGGAADIPMVLGFTRDENLTPWATVRTLEQYRSGLNEKFAEAAPSVFARYLATDDRSAQISAQRLGRDLSFNLMMHNWATLQTENGQAPVWAYEFARGHPYVPGVKFTDMDPKTAGVYHTAEVPYFFGTFQSFNSFRQTRNWGSEDEKLSNTIMNYIVRFAKDGNPNSAGLPKWPHYETKNEKVLVLSEKIHANEWPGAQNMALIGRREEKEKGR